MVRYRRYDLQVLGNESFGFVVFVSLFMLDYFCCCAIMSLVEEAEEGTC